MFCSGFLYFSRMKTLILALLIVAPLFLRAQSKDEAEIKSTISRLFEGMRKSDSAMVRSAFSAGAILQTVKDDKAGFSTASGDRLDDFLKAVAKPKTQNWDEQISGAKINIDGNLASVWAPYTFRLGGKLHHCGIDSFQLVKGKDGWRIVYLIDTQKACK